MGRRELPLDPAAGPVQRFAHELRELRRQAGGITYRAMAQRTECSAPTLSRAASGEQLPSLPVALAYAKACGGDAAEWEERWRRAAREVAAVPPERGEDEGEPPYRGLARFDAADGDRFFGREALVATLVDCAVSHRITVVVGPSGSGKSSLLRAGLIPRLQHTTDPASRRWPLVPATRDQGRPYVTESDRGRPAVLREADGNRGHGVTDREPSESTV